MSGQQLRLNKAYQRVDLIDEDDKPVFQAEKGAKQLLGLFGDRVVHMEQHPLHIEQVDHHIEEVGIMAIKQVRYVTQKQWQKMIEMQKNHKEIWNYLQQISRYQTRHKIASNIPRNQKGQFVAKEAPKQKKIKPERKRGRPSKDKKIVEQYQKLV